MNRRRKLRVGDLIRWRPDHNSGVVYAVRWSAQLGRIVLAQDLNGNEIVLPSVPDSALIERVGHDLFTAEVRLCLMSADAVLAWCRLTPGDASYNDFKDRYAHARRNCNRLSRLRKAREAQARAIALTKTFAHRAPKSCDTGVFSDAPAQTLKEIP